MKTWLKHIGEAAAAVGAIVFLAGLIGLIIPWIVLFFQWYFSWVLGL